MLSFIEDKIISINSIPHLKKLQKQIEIQKPLRKLKKIGSEEAADKRLLSYFNFFAKKYEGNGDPTFDQIKNDSSTIKLNEWVKFINKVCLSEIAKDMNYNKKVKGIPYLKNLFDRHCRNDKCMNFQQF